MSILVTGGAGYVGSHCVATLRASGREVVVIDNLSKGHRAALKPDVRLYEGDLRDAAFLADVFSKEQIEAVMHFAAFSLVGESMEDPGKYFLNNLAGTVTLLEEVRRHGDIPFIFSSTAATYGQPDTVPITEDMPQVPTNPYGESKLMVEKALRWYDEAYGLRSVSLRYFNVAGAWDDGAIGEDHRPETHLIPLVLTAALGKREFVSVYGNDYDTPDGTCLRDYIQMEDLIDAHIRALDYLQKGGRTERFNLGIGQGFSVMEIIEAARRVTGRHIEVRMAPRRAGDPAVLIASGDKAGRVLGWHPKHKEIDGIIASAWAWHSKQPDGYGEQTT